MYTWDSYVSIYTLHELTAVKNITTSTCIHTFHIIGICPWTHMPAIWHMKSHCTTNVVYMQTHITAHISQKKMKCNFIYYAKTLYVPVSLKSYIYATYANYFMCTWDNYVSIYTSYELTAMKNVIGNKYTCILHYWYIPLNKYVCHTAYICPTDCLLQYMYRPCISVHIHQKSINATFIYHTTAKYVPETNMPHKCHMTKLLHKHQWMEYANTCPTYELTGINHVTRSTVHRWQQC